MAPNTEKIMPKLGKLYEGLCKIPMIGEPLARSMNRNMGRMIFRMPGSGSKRQGSITELKEYLLQTGREMNFPFEIIEETVGPDSFEFYVGGCPYGYKRPDQAKACDAAMEMDRTLFDLLGGELIVLEAAPEGVQKCRILMKWKG